MQTQSNATPSRPTTSPSTTTPTHSAKELTASIGSIISSHTETAEAEKHILQSSIHSPSKFSAVSNFMKANWKMIAGGAVAAGLITLGVKTLIARQSKNPNMKSSAPKEK